MILDSAKEVWEKSEMMVKVKEPLPEEYPYFHKDLILYTYLHLAADRPQMEALMKAEVKGVAYETLMEKDGSLPLLAPMSQIAGRLSIQEGAKYLEKTFGGYGVLLAGVPGTPKAKVVILGGGNVGTNACKIAVGMGADVTVIDMNLHRLAYLDDLFGGRIQTLYSTDAVIEKSCGRRGSGDRKRTDSRKSSAEADEESLSEKYEEGKRDCRRGSGSGRLLRNHKGYLSR